MQFVRDLYCKLPTNGKQLPAFPLEDVPGIEPRPQRWEPRVLPLCHRGPSITVGDSYMKMCLLFVITMLSLIDGQMSLDTFVHKICAAIQVQFTKAV